MSKIELLRALEKRMKRCRKCKELVAHRTQTVFDHDGNPDAELVFIGQAPGEFENEKGKPFVTSPRSAGKVLNEKILPVWMGLTREDVFVCNIVCCWPPKKQYGDKKYRDREPTSAEVDCCRPFLDETLAIIKPKLICCLGTVASQRLLRTSESLESLRKGGIHKYKVPNFKEISVICVNHPKSSTTTEERLEDIQRLKGEMKRLKREKRMSR